MAIMNKIYEFILIEGRTTKKAIRLNFRVPKNIKIHCQSGYLESNIIFRAGDKLITHYPTDNMLITDYIFVEITKEENISEEKITKYSIDINDLYINKGIINIVIFERKTNLIFVSGCLNLVKCKANIEYLTNYYIKLIGI